MIVKSGAPGLYRRDAVIGRGDAGADLSLDDMRPIVEETPPFMRALTFASMDTQNAVSNRAAHAPDQHIVVRHAVGMHVIGHVDLGGERQQEQEDEHEAAFAEIARDSGRDVPRDVHGRRGRVVGSRTGRIAAGHRDVGHRRGPLFHVKRPSGRPQ